MKVTNQLSVNFAFVIVLICCLSAAAQTEKSAAQKLNEYFGALAAEREFNGNVLVAENGTVVYKKSFGYADFESCRLNAAETEFDLASITKTFTAVAVLQLKDEGKLNLDEKFKRYVHDFPYPEITVRQMLSHQTGLPDYELFLKSIDENPDRVFENKHIIPALVGQKIALKFPPGERWRYGNFNFALLALLVEKLSGEKIKDYFRKRIFDPAKMNRTYVKTATVNTRAAPNLAGGYSYQFLYSSDLVNVKRTFSNPFYKRLYHNHGFIGDANVYSTSGDLLKFDQALYGGALLKNETLAEAFAPSRLSDGAVNRLPPGFGGLGNSSNGLGWFVLDDEATIGKIVWHSGGRPGAVTMFLRNLTKKQTVIVLDNATSPGLYRKAFSAMNILNEKPVLPVKKSLAKVYGRTLMTVDADHAAARLNEFKADTENFALSEDEMNNLAYEMLENNHPAQALETFKVNTFLFPASDNVYQSYGEGLLKIGKKLEAAMMFKKALEINPANGDAKEMLRRTKSENPTKVRQLP